MMPEGLIERIKAAGYTRVVIRPIDAPEELTIAQAREAVEKASVSLRGWDYPHVARRNDEHGGYETFAEFAQDWCDWHYHREFWRMYKSGQFLHYKALREDLSTDENVPNRDGPILAIGSLVYTVTEVTEFAHRLFRHGLYKSGAYIQLTLGGARGRQLWVDDPNRMPFSMSRITSSENISHNVSLSPSELEAGDPKDPALSMLLNIFDAFGWRASPEQTRKQQDQLYGLELGRG